MNQSFEARLSLSADRQAMMRLRGFVDAFAAARGIGGEDVNRVLVAIEELVTNLVKYGYPGAAVPGSIVVTLRLDDDRLSVEIVDDGQEFDPFAQPPPDLDVPLEERSVGGLGLHLVRSLMEQTSHRRERGRNVTVIGRRVALAEGVARKG